MTNRNLDCGASGLPIWVAAPSKMRRIRRWLIRLKLALSDLLMQRGRKQIQPTDLKARAIGFVVREQAGDSQERLSGECGFDRTYISRVERGIINPTVSRLWQIADASENPVEPNCQADGTMGC